MLTSKTIRRSGPTAIVHSGGKQTIFGCVCGARHTAATNYRDAKHVRDWRRQHDESCRAIYEAIRDGRLEG